MQRNIVYQGAAATPLPLPVKVLGAKGFDEAPALRPRLVGQHQYAADPIRPPTASTVPLVFNGGSPEIALDSAVLAHEAIVAVPIAAPAATLLKALCVSEPQFARPFPVGDQQYAALAPQSVPTVAAFAFAGGSPEVTIDTAVIAQHAIVLPPSATPVVSRPLVTAFNEGLPARTAPVAQIYSAPVLFPIPVRGQPVTAFNEGLPSRSAPIHLAYSATVLFPTAATTPPPPLVSAFSERQISRAFPVGAQQYAALAPPPAPSVAALAFAGGSPEVTTDTTILAQDAPTLFPVVAPANTQVFGWQSLNAEALTPSYPVTEQPFDFIGWVPVVPTPVSPPGHGDWPRHLRKKPVRPIWDRQAWTSPPQAAVAEPPQAIRLPAAKPAIGIERPSALLDALLTRSLLPPLLAPVRVALKKRHRRIVAAASVTEAPDRAVGQGAVAIVGQARLAEADTGLGTVSVAIAATGGLREADYGAARALVQIEARCGLAEANDHLTAAASWNDDDLAITQLLHSQPDDELAMRLLGAVEAAPDDDDLALKLLLDQP